MSGLPAELLVQYSFEKLSMRYGFCSLSQLLMDPHSCGTNNLGKQSFKTAVSFGVAFLKDNCTWPYPTFGSFLTLGLKEKERKKSGKYWSSPCIRRV